MIAGGCIARLHLSAMGIKTTHANHVHFCFQSTGNQSRNCFQLRSEIIICRIREPVNPLSQQHLRSHLHICLFDVQLF